MQETNGRWVRRLLVATLKGGPGKTTTSWFLALAYALVLGFNVVLIDADTRTQGSTDWYRKALARGYTVPITVLTWTDKDGPISTYAKKAEAQYNADVVIIDTGGEQPDVFVFAAMYADRLVSPCGPLEAEVSRMHSTRDAAAAVDEQSPLLVSVLLTRCPQPGRGEAKKWRATLAEEPTDETPDALDMHVLDTEIKRDLDIYAGSYGRVPDAGGLGDYKALLDELEGEGRWDQHDDA